MIGKKEYVGDVLNLFISKKSTDSMIVDQQGIVDDKFYAKDINRSVLISSIESYNMAKSIGIDLEIGKLGENILINYNPYDLEAGTQIEIGEVILEINQRCTLCKSLTKIDNKLPKLLKDDRGIFSRVIKSGTIKIEDKIYII
jgi:MOSC domain-containing protein YiiM